MRERPCGSPGNVTITTGFLSALSARNMTSPPRDPSRDQARFSSSCGPEVTGRAGEALSPAASAGTTRIFCARAGSSHPAASRRNSARVMIGTSLVRMVSCGTSLGSVLLVKASHFPSGDYTAADAPFVRLVSRRGSPSSSGSRQSWGDFLSPLRRNTSALPAGRPVPSAGRPPSATGADHAR
jgi:hypothetical protein